MKDCLLSSSAISEEVLEDKEDRKGRSWIEVNIKNLKYNAKVLKSLMPAGCELMAVVKANAYGHGAVPVSRAMNEIGVRSFAVATLSEGIELRRSGILGEILVLGYTDIHQARWLKEYQLTQTVIDYEYATRLDDLQLGLPVHLKLDTGMHRLGMDGGDTLRVAQIFNRRGIRVKAMFTHLSAADQRDEDSVAYTTRQIEEFYSLVEELREHKISIPKLHIQSSYGLMNYPLLHCDYARIGIALYGSFSKPGDQRGLPVKLKPVLSLKSRIAMIRRVAAGESVSYGRETVLTRDSIIAVLPIGYADGLPRSLSGGRGEVLLQGQRAAIVGRVCMDQLLIDVTDIPGAKPGNTVTLIGREGQEELSASEAALAAGSITNELLCRLGNRLERIYLE